jgi:hypothetical protein
MDTGMKHRRKVTILKLWQVRALRNKRTPLPEHPNETPWEDLKDRNLVVVLAELTSLGKSEHPVSLGRPRFCKTSFIHGCFSRTRQRLPPRFPRITDAGRVRK